MVSRLGAVAILLAAGVPTWTVAAERVGEIDQSRLVSEVGAVSSYVASFESDGVVHPSYDCHLTSVYRKPAAGRRAAVQRPARITDLFPEADVYLALSHAWPVMVKLHDPWPSNLTELLGQLKPTCEAAWDELPNAFAVIAVVDDASEGASAVVRFGIGCGCEAGRGSRTEFDVLIPIALEDVATFRSAAARKRLGRQPTCGGSHEWSCCLKWMK